MLMDAALLWLHGLCTTATTTATAIGTAAVTAINIVTAAATDADKAEGYLISRTVGAPLRT